MRTPRRGLLEIRSDGKRRLGLPDDESLAAALRGVDRLQHAVEHVVADRVHAALETDDCDVVTGMPAAHGVGFKHRLTIAHFLAQQPVRVRLPPVHRELRPGLIRVAGRRVRAPGVMHAGASVLDRPRRQRHVGHRPACGDVFIDPGGHPLPTGGLPDLEGSAFPAETPADRKVEIARVVCDFGEVHRAVVKRIAEDRPHELRLGMAGRMQLRKPLGDVLVLQDLDHRIVGLGV